jgi:hypothetical protein
MFLLLIDDLPVWIPHSAGEILFIILQQRRQDPFQKTAYQVGSDHNADKYYCQADQLITKPRTAFGAEMVFKKIYPAEIVKQPFGFSHDNETYGRHD